MAYVYILAAYLAAGGIYEYILYNYSNFYVLFEKQIREKYYKPKNETHNVQRGLALASVLNILLWPVHIMINLRRSK